MNARSRFGAVGSCLLILLLVRATPAETPPFQQFFGDYVGEAISEGSGEIGKRDVRVTIEPHRDGFRVTWVVVIQKASGKIKRGQTTVNFQPSKRPNIYSSAMSTDVFGHPVPLDPMRGDPYVWARIEGPTLWVYYLFITDAGGYEMQVYERTLVPGGMELEFSRVRDGAIQRTVTGTLKKIP